MVSQPPGRKRAPRRAAWAFNSDLSMDYEYPPGRPENVALGGGSCREPRLTSRQQLRSAQPQEAERRDRCRIGDRAIEDHSLRLHQRKAADAQALLLGL